MIIKGDSFEELKKLEDNSVDSIITDPPYDIGFMGKKWDKKSLITNADFWKECLRVLKPGGHLLSFGHSRTSHRMVTAVEEAGFEIRDTIMWLYGSGFPKSHNVAIAIDKKLGKMGHRGKEFDTGAKDAYEHYKQKRAIVAVEEHQAISDEAKEWQGWGTALKPAYEPITMARKPLGEDNVALNVMKWGTGGINIDECRVGTEKIKINKLEQWSGFGQKERPDYETTEALGRFPANVILDSEAGELLDEQGGFSKSSKRTKKYNKETENRSGYTPVKSDYREDNTYSDSGGASRYFKSIDTELCASIQQQEHKEPQSNIEPITLARKPLEGTVAENVLQHGTGALNIDATRVQGEPIQKNVGYKKDYQSEGWGTKKCITEVQKGGRFPANVILDEEAGELLDEQAPKVGNGHRAKTKITGYGKNYGGTQEYNGPGEKLDGLGGASRFFYCPKVSRKERELNPDSLESANGQKGKNNHPTVKPVKLMEYLVKLVTRQGGVVLDPFAGSGSTGVAAKNLGMKYILIEREAEYCDIIKARLS